ncbi:GGDEF domain-containing protein [Shewanella sp. 1_MG-2023]|uniref:tetratricopeptide repeat-containing diguanylate cyclase n=1 Tax=unclassified Shewanella TaxID=196818 RepID=UPI0026E3BF13|nr:MULTISPECIES: GGDEF domain-containing protein [unclassified Shewanella]MDO6613822.1 GGDEF domain-containing protein [Shewanella sp. 7_MG-2023]MDO6773572.1 GGDEF domain-containing protein [Shewanella sp. 2_MG-2023]MDO6796429.1 GGDEF domain-containing protein [Shewanella sp. 1_MG-2023]
MIKLLNGIALILLLSSYSIAQEKIIDTDMPDIDILLKQADKVRSQQPKQFNHLLAYLKTFESDFTSEQSNYYRYLYAYQLGFKGDFNQAQRIWESISKSQVSTELKFRANLSLVNIFSYTKEWSEGLVYLEENLKNLHLIENSEVSQLGIFATAMFYNQIGQYELALNYANQIDMLAIEDRNQCIVKHQIVESKFYLSKINLESIEISQALKSCLISEESVWYNLTNSFIAKLHIKNGSDDEAIKLLLNNINDVETVNYIPVMAIFNSLLAKAYLNLGEYEKAFFYGEKSIALIPSISNSDTEMIAYEVLYKVAVREQAFEAALNYYIKFAEAEKSYFDDLKTKYLAFQLAQHRAVEQKVQIELLNKQNKLLKASQRLAESETENNRLFMALLIMVISLLAIAAIRSNRNQKRLKHLAQIDSLTQIYNRGHFNTAAQDAMSACQVNQDDISCILFDLDKFKTINDNYGHACGDWVLKNVARTCMNIGRTNDIFARLGGEEFCIILSRCDAVTALKIAEDYRKAIANIDSSPSGYTFPITASFGVTDSVQSGYSVEALTGHADNAMYLAKSTGRNKVCNYADVLASKESCSVII